MHINPKGRDWGLIVNWDDLGKLYTGIIITWSIVLFAGIGWLLWNRKLPFVRIRSLPLTIASTLFLHTYLLKIFMAYTTNGHFTCGAEFWIMSIYLPFGIALWQVNCTQLRSIAERQERLLTRQLSFNRTLALPGTRTSLWTRWKSLSQAQKSYVFVAIGLVVQFLVTAILYATTPELQGDWSSYGKIPFNKGQGKCRKSLVWIPSAFWQLFWTWIYGPYELYKIRHIRDSHRWRLQTLLCIVSGLPGSPLWLAAVFTNTAFKPVNRWFVPPMWLAPGIIVMQFANIFFPIFETIEYGKAMRKTIHSIGSESTLRGSIITIEKQRDQPEPQDDSANKLFGELNSSYQGRSLFSINALERALIINPSPLLHYAATKDFTAENIIFLTEINCWRDAWKAAPKDLNTGMITEAARTRLFEMAVEIFITSIYEKTAEFPINIEGFLRRELMDIFEAAVPEGQRPSGESGRVRRPSEMFGIVPTQNGIDLNRMADCSATLWDDQKTPATVTVSAAPPSTPPSPGAVYCEFSSTATTPNGNREDEQPFAFESHPSISPLGAAGAKIREGFDEHVFDAAEASIKYLVLTNTWRKFVQLREREQMLAQDV